MKNPGGSGPGGTTGADTILYNKKKQKTTKNTTKKLL